MVAFYKHDIPAWMDGTESLSDGGYRLYHVVCQLIYLHEGPIALNEHGLAGRCRQSIRAFRANLKELLDSGKLVLVNGRLDNSRAEKELEKIDENRENASKGGKKSGEARKCAPNLLINNKPIEAPLQDERSLKDYTRLDETSHSAHRAESEPVLKKSRRKPSTSVPDDWKPLEADVEYAERLGLSKADIQREAEKFRNHAKSQDRHCVNWGIAFRNWCIRAAEIGGKRPIGSAATEIDWDRHVREFRETSGSRWPWKVAGPDPDSFGCRAPPDILAKYGFDVSRATTAA